MSTANADPYVTAYSGRQQVPIETWERIRPLVDHVTSAAGRTPYTTGAIGSVTAQLAWWCDREGLDLRAEVVLHPDNVDRFVVDGCKHLSAGTRLNYQSQLRRVGEIVVGPPLYATRRAPMRPSNPLAPYSGAEIAALLGWARGLPTVRLRDNVMVLIAFVLGTGLTSQELSTLVGTDVVKDEHGVVVYVARGRRKRAVPVLRRWEVAVTDVAQRSGERPVLLLGRETISPKDISRLIEDCPAADAPTLSPQRLRATWIVAQLPAGLRELEVAAGASAAQLAVYVRYLGQVDPIVARERLRGP